VIGALKLTDIRPQHLNNFYSSLLKQGVRKDSKRSTAKPALSKTIAEKGFTQKYIATVAGIGETTLREMLRGKPVRTQTAAAVAKALGKSEKALFDVEQDMRPLSKKTVLEYHRLISTILAQAEKELLVPYNAAAKATPPTAKKQVPNYFQPEVVAEILDALETEPLKYQLITILLISTGCRRGEIMGLKWEKINFEDSRVLIDSALLYTKSMGVYEDTTKTEDIRWLKLPEETMEMLKRYRAEQNRQRLKCGSAWIESGYVFTKDNGERMHPDSATDWLAEFSKRHQLPHINPHAFRHTAASVLISNGIDVVTVSKQLGHASVSTTENYYSHIIDETKSKASECIAEVLLRRRA
jgi:integrase